MTQSAVAPAVSDFAKEVSERLERLLALAADGGLDAVDRPDDDGHRGRCGDSGVRDGPFGGVRHGDRGPCRRPHPDATRLLSATSCCTAACRCSVAAVGRALNATRASLPSCGTSRRSIAGTSSSSPPTPASTGRWSGMALLAKEKGHDVIAVTSLQHTAQVQPKHPSGLTAVGDRRRGDRQPGTLRRRDSCRWTGAALPSAPISSITSAFIAQLLTIGVAERMHGDGQSAAAVPVSQHPWRGRAQPCARTEVPGTDPRGV